MFKMIYKMLRFHLGTTRFTNETWAQNLQYRKENRKYPCIYGLPVEMPKAIRLGEPVYVIEMNISQGNKKIMGIGYVMNFRHRDQYYRIYSNVGYNRCIYKGQHWCCREQLDKGIVTALEKVLFKGKGHMCRGQGVTRLKTERLEDDEGAVIAYMKQLFTSQTPPA